MGHVDSVATRATTRFRRTVAIEFGALRPQRRILWAGNLRVGQIAGTARRDEFLRGIGSRSETRNP
jgi:hypothetical protein